jgi:hypothetical protein
VATSSLVRGAAIDDRVTRCRIDLDHNAIGHQNRLLGLSMTDEKFDKPQLLKLATGP